MKKSKSALTKISLSIDVICRLIRPRFARNKRLYIVLAFIGALLLTYIFSLPAVLFNKPASTVIEDCEGRLLGARLAADGQWRFPAADAVPRKYAQAVILFEDKRFYHHAGVDFFALARALRQDVAKRKIVSGGSTVSMQVIRLMQDNPPRNILQKLKEIILATRLEIRCSKEEILSLYAANAPFGGNVVGLGAASWRYFGREPDELSWAEAATLAVLPNAPSLIHPGRNRTRLLNKRNLLLDRLLEQGVISAEDCSLAKDEPLPDKPHALPSDAPQLLDRVSGKHTGKRVTTTIQQTLQQRVNDIVRKYAATYKGNFVHNMAVVVAEVETGDVLAYVGNAAESAHDSQVDIIQAPRSTGSILKPLLYATMLDHGELLPDMLVTDVPLQIRNFTPKNFDHGFDGAVPARRALQRSLNVPAVRLLQQHGIEKFHQLLRNMGMSTLAFPAEHYGLTLILGGAEGTLWDVAGMYAEMARILNHFPVYMNSYDADDLHGLNFLQQQSRRSSGKRLEGSAPIDAAAIWQTFRALSELNRPEEEATWKNFSSSQKIAWKTGTSYGFRDAWAVGVTPQYVVGVWVGNASGEGRPALTGVNYAAPVLFDVFAQLPRGVWFPTPYDDLTPAVVCRKSGYRASPLCEERDTVLIARSGTESDVCPFHQLIHLDKERKHRVTSECYNVSDMVHVPWFVLPPSQEWFYKSRNMDYKPLPPVHPDCLSTEGQQQMDLIYPQPNLIVVLPRQLDGTEGQAVFRAAHRRSSATIFWHIDRQFVGSTQSPHRIAVATGQGEHTLTFVDDKGSKLTGYFIVEER
ncbi:MAG: penicillin-binding protein 1C [Bacteroidales bacterium]|nr:penicillin-binding protein 1C [Bacteroidales bacterium]